jgi:hypothetical protein
VTDTDIDIWYPPPPYLKLTELPVNPLVPGRWLLTSGLKREAPRPFRSYWSKQADSTYTENQLDEIIKGRLCAGHSMRSFLWDQIVRDYPTRSIRK